MIARNIRLRGSGTPSPASQEGCSPRFPAQRRPPPPPGRADGTRSSAFSGGGGVGAVSRTSGAPVDLRWATLAVDRKICNSFAGESGVGVFRAIPLAASSTPTAWRVHEKDDYGAGSNLQKDYSSRGDEHEDHRTGRTRLAGRRIRTGAGGRRLQQDADNPGDAGRGNRSPQTIGQSGLALCGGRRSSQAGLHAGRARRT